MKHSLLLGLTCGLLILGADAVSPPPLSAQAEAKPTSGQPPINKAGKVPRTHDGRPDLSGTWDWRTIVPLQRPRELSAKETLTDADIQQLEERKREQEAVGDDSPTSPYNRFWFDEGTSVGANRRTSIITDPPDGRFPPLAPEGQRRANTEPWNRNPRSQPRPAHSFDNPEEVVQATRCIMGQNSGPPMQPGFYNNNMQLVQTADYVMMHTEMIHTARIVPLDGRPHLPFPQWSGSSRGHWEGDTLVVETRNFRDRGVGALTFNTDANMVIVERFTRDVPDTLRYEFTVTDPTVWTKPWSGLLQMKKSSEIMFEYACHEGNYSLQRMLEAARFDDRAAAKKK